MGVFEGKSPAERNKIIAAIVLGTLAIISLVYTFGGSIFSRSKPMVAVEADATPTATATSNSNNTQTPSNTAVSAPDEVAINNDYITNELIFNGSVPTGPIGGRNIFAFYEPPAPTPPPPPTPTPSITPTPFSPPPTPTPHPIFLSFISPQSTYAGSKAFRLVANGDKFSTEAKIVFNGTPLKTTFVSERRLYADVPATFISRAGVGQIVIDTFDGQNYSKPLSLNIQEPPKPKVEYIGMIARKHYNNDTAYFQRDPRSEPEGKRLNDVVDGRFRIVSISEKEVELEDTRLGFRHKLAMKIPDPNTFTRPTPRRRIRRRPNRRRSSTRRNIPGIPNNIPRATPRPRRTPNRNVKRP